MKTIRRILEFTARTNDVLGAIIVPVFIGVLIWAALTGRLS